MLPGEAENGVGMNRSVREGKKCEAFERSNGLDTALYKNYLWRPFVILGKPLVATVNGNHVYRMCLSCNNCIL